MDVGTMDPLDLKIQKIREKNALISQRHKEVERDKEEALKHHAMVNVCAPSEDWTSHHLADAVPTRREPVPSRRDSGPGRRDARPRAKNPSNLKQQNSDAREAELKNAAQEKAWRNERDKVDRERIGRQKTADGWKREWDREKSPQPPPKTADLRTNTTGARSNMLASPSKREPVSYHNKDLPVDSCNKDPPRPIRHCNFPPPEDLKFHISGLSPEAQSVMSRLNRAVDSQQRDTNANGKMSVAPQYYGKEVPLMKREDVLKSHSAVPDSSRHHDMGLEPKPKLFVNTRQSDSKPDVLPHSPQQCREECRQPRLYCQEIDDDTSSVPDLIPLSDDDYPMNRNVSNDISQDISQSNSDASGLSNTLNDSGRKVLFSGMSTQVCIQNDAFIAPELLNAESEPIVEKPNKIMFPVSSTETCPPQSTDEKWFESNQDPASPQKQTVVPTLLSNHDSDSDDYWSDIPTSQESDEDECPPLSSSGPNNMVIKINVAENTRKVQGEK